MLTFFPAAHTYIPTLHPYFMGDNRATLQARVLIMGNFAGVLAASWDKIRAIPEPTNNVITVALCVLFVAALTWMREAKRGLNRLDARSAPAVTFGQEANTSSKGKEDKKTQ